MMESLMEDLAEDECIDLLKRHHFGRVAFAERVELPPVILPLNYLVAADTVVVRTDPAAGSVAHSGMPW